MSFDPEVMGATAARSLRFIGWSTQPLPPIAYAVFLNAVA